MAPSEILIRPLRDDDSISDLTSLLHRAYAGYAAQGLDFPAATQPESRTREQIAAGRYFVATLGGMIVGSVLYYPRDTTRVSEWYQRPGVVRFGRFAVEPGCRGQGIGTKLLAHVENVARAGGAAELALDTFEKATDLVAMYAKMGFRIVAHDDRIMPPDRCVIMSKTLSR